MARGFVGADAIRIDGLRDLARSLKAVQDGLQKEIPRVLKPIAEGVASKARGRIRSRSGKLAGSIRPFATQRAAGVRMGKKGVEYAGPNEFGGYPAGREFIPEGRAIYPTFKDEAPKVERQVVDALEGLIRKAGLQ